MNHISNSIGILIFFSVTFVGDFFIYNFPAFFICYLANIAFRFYFRIKLNLAEIISQLFIFKLLLVIMIVNSHDINKYYLTFLFSILYVNCIPNLVWIFFRKNIGKTIFGIVIIIFIFLFSQFLNGGIRNSIIFGPNVFYRILGFLMSISIVNLALLSTGKKRLFPFLILFWCLCMALTGSRGAAVVIIFVGFACFIQIIHNKDLRKRIFHPIFIGLLVLVASINSKIILENFWRLFDFQLTGASFQARISFLRETQEYWKNINLKQFLFGDGESQRVFEYYPHNIFAEYFVYHGMFLTLLVGLVYMALIFGILRKMSLKSIRLLIIFAFCPLILGSLFSGSLYESYPLVALGGMLLTGAPSLPASAKV